MKEMNFAGMTTNERIHVAGLSWAFESAAKASDRERMIAVLRKVELGDQAEQIADAILADLKRYGF